MTEPRVEAGGRALETARKEQEQNVRIAKMQTEPEYRDPTAAELESPAFNAVWNAIKGWDMSRTSNGLYSGATGTDVCIILDALQSAMNAQERELNAAIGILARLPWCECGHQHVGGEMCMGCDCFQQIPVSREWVVNVVKKLAAERLLAERGDGR